MSEQTLEEVKEQFQRKSLIGILKVQDRLLEIMNAMKEFEEGEDEEEMDFQEFEAILDLYRTMTDIVEMKTK